MPFLRRSSGKRPRASLALTLLTFFRLPKKKTPSRLKTDSFLETGRCFSLLFLCRVPLPRLVPRRGERAKTTKINTTSESRETGDPPPPPPRAADGTMLLSSAPPAPAPPAVASRSSSTSPTNLATAPLSASPRFRSSSTLCYASGTLYSSRSIEIRPLLRAQSSRKLGLDPRGIIDLRCPSRTSAATSCSSVAAAAAASSSSSSPQPVAAPGQTKVAFLGMGIMGVAMVRLKIA